MKKSFHRIILLAIPLAASPILTSCVTDPNQSQLFDDQDEGGYTTYVTLPDDYSGDAYYYNNRYYAGGRYEPGTYTYRGRTYNNRYYHNGQYIYGGEFCQRSSSVGFRGSAIRPTSSTSYMTYRTLPTDYSGDAYYYNNMYYAGGRYEEGPYSYRGRTYDHRYFHNGQYIYGGEFRRSGTTISTHRSDPSYRTTTRRVTY